MTLPASGNIDYADFTAELKTSGSIVFPDDRSRWLAGVPSGNLIIPTHFYGKRAVKLTDFVGGVQTPGIVTFNNVQFGSTFPGRVLIAAIALANAANSQFLNIAACQIGATLGGGNDSGETGASGAIGTATAGIFVEGGGNGAATQGNVAVSFDSAYSVDMGVCCMFAAAGITSPTTLIGQNGGGSGRSVGSVDAAISSNGVAIGLVVRANTGADVDLSGPGLERVVAAVVASHRIEACIGNRRPAGTQSIAWIGSVVRASGLRLTTFV